MKKYKYNLELTKRLSKLYTGAVYDVMREMKIQNFVLPNTIRPLDPNISLSGPIWTCSGAMDVNISDHESLVSWTGLLSNAPSEHVIVCQPNDDTIVHMGELSAETLNDKGVKGYVVDGGSRDNDFIKKLGWPVFFKYYTPKDVVGRWKVTSMGEPINIGGVTIETGDYLLGDIDGIIKISSKEIEKIVNRAEVIMQTENQVRKKILEGMDPQEAYLKYGVF